MKKIVLCFLLMMSPSIVVVALRFMGISIGMTRGEAIEAAEKNDIMTVHKNKDVDFFLIKERKIPTVSIKTEVPFIYLQFFHNVLYAITVIFDENMLITTHL